MRITIINQFYTPDVAPTASLAASLAEHRAAPPHADQVTVIAGKGGYTGGPRPGHAPGPRATDAANPRVRRVWTPGLGKATHLKRIIDYAAFYIFAVLKTVMLPRQDVIISLTTPPLIACAGLLHKLIHPGGKGRRGRTRLILWNMDCYPDVAERSGVLRPGGPLSRIVRAVNRRIFRQLDHLVCLDEAMAGLLCEQYATSNPRLPVTIVPNWERAAMFPPDAPHAPWPGWPELGLAPPDSRFIVLYLGNMGYGHAFETVLDAAEALKDEPVSFVFIGGGRRAAEIAAEVRRRGLVNIAIRGYVPKDQTGSLMTGASCALVTLRDEAKGTMSPSKIHSNLAMGLPLIYIGPEGTNVDEAIRHFGCGISLRHGQSGELISFIRRLRDDERERRGMRRLAREAFESAYCDRATLPRFDAVIAHAVSGERTADIPTADARHYSHAPAAPAPALPEPAPLQRTVP